MKYRFHLNSERYLISVTVKNFIFLFLGNIENSIFRQDNEMDLL